MTICSFYWCGNLHRVQCEAGYRSTSWTSRHFQYAAFFNIHPVYTLPELPLQEIKPVTLLELVCEPEGISAISGKFCTAVDLNLAPSLTSAVYGRRKYFGRECLRIGISWKNLVSGIWNSACAL